MGIQTLIMNKKILGAALICCFIYSLTDLRAERQKSTESSGMSYEQKLQACSTCHGKNGDEPLVPEYPVLAGQYQDYLANSLRAYKDGRRQHPVMNIQMKVLGLTDSDIKRLSQYFSSRKGLNGLGE